MIQQQTIDSVVRSYILESGESDNKYARFLEIAINGLMELHMDVSGAPKVTLLDIDTSLDIANLPNDYIRYVRIGVVDGAGHIHALGQANRLMPPRSFSDCGVPEATVNSNVNNGMIVGIDGVSDNYRNGEFVGRMFGVSGGANAYGYYRIDKERGTINFSELPTGVEQVVLEYIGDLNEVNGEYVVHPFLVQVIKDWIEWRKKKYKGNLGETRMAEQDYWLSYRTANRRFSSSTTEEWIAAFRKGFIGGVPRQ